MKSSRFKSTDAPLTLTGETKSIARHGVLLGITAYMIWGSFPVFFKALEGATPIEIVCHRITWSAAFLFVLVCTRRQLPRIWNSVLDRSILLTLCGSTLLIATNWLVFLFAIQKGEVLQSSLGYFMTPLISVLLGFVFLRERLTLWQSASVFFALVGVLNLSFNQGQFPWIALTLAISFSLYGLLRKLAKVEAMIGLTVETLLLAPISLAYLVYLSYQQEGAFLSGSLQLNILLPMSGVVTAIPLLFFVGAARRLRLSTIGFLQYITPSLHFVLAVGLYGEVFSRSHLFSFIFIWIGLGIYSIDAILQNSKTEKENQYI